MRSQALFRVRFHLRHGVAAVAVMKVACPPMKGRVHRSHNLTELQWRSLPRGERFSPCVNLQPIVADPVFARDPRHRWLQRGTKIL